MPVQLYGLFPLAENRFAYCVTAASSELQARQQAAEHGAEYGIDWMDRQTVRCDTVAHVGGPMPAEGSIFFHRSDDRDG